MRAVSRLISTLVRAKCDKLRSRRQAMAILKSRVGRLVIALSCLTIPALAHHSFGAEYDSTKPITLTGTITKIDWTNPHSFIFLDVKDDKGNVANWRLEGYPPNVLYRTGWKKDPTMKPADTVTLSGYRARD